MHFALKLKVKNFAKAPRSGLKNCDRRKSRRGDCYPKGAIPKKKDFLAPLGERLGEGFLSTPPRVSRSILVGRGG